MNRKSTALIESGVLELYVFGMATDDQIRDVESAQEKYPAVAEELNQIHQRIESFGKANAVKPPSLVKTVVMAAADYMERLRNGEKFLDAPILTEKSTIEDFSHWLNRKDMVLAEVKESIYAKIISSTDDRTTSIVWAKDCLEPEIHSNERESFLIVEGTCEVSIDDETHYLKPGDFLSIPLHTNHSAKVTSDIPCKFIMQRALLHVA
ncbi:cupin domain-containing protein [Owenweeksia hongkongensis]|uniref:Cupin domain-containing protein n=1 Tax=Owenweeksia hongkongensis (strain DSM 17368 / CIP 108786 / JCM 12287 / NRRL B-23963 / UST20020801) TaxID=926562 RepID=G8QZU2_OWEHD|nr:cupin domain-containing protein [Owenweeksia hongkongensis]AEV31536.1 cupin domain-containing protein [Owenweeksia hongkongensis DSM 17368]